MTDQEYLRRIGARIKEARMAKAISQTQLAASCNIAKGNLSRIESGKTNFTVLTLKRICAQLEIDEGDLFKC